MDTTATVNAPLNAGAQDLKDMARSNRKQRVALGWCIAITLITMMVELVASWITGSLMLYSDALHMLSHAASLAVSFIAAQLALRKVGTRFPFGLRKIETLAAFLNGIGLIWFTIYIAMISIDRLFNPVAISSQETIAVAIVGLLVNLLTALILSRAGLENLNTKSAFLHMLADTFSSVAIIAGGIVIYYTQWFALDAILSLVVAAVVGKWAVGLIWDSSLLLIDATPKDVKQDAIREGLTQSFPILIAINDLKVWEAGTGHRVALVKGLVQTTPQEDVDLQQAMVEYLCSKHGLAEAHVQLHSLTEAAPQLSPIAEEPIPMRA